jgi:preprotein translocase subunit YajC
MAQLSNILFIAVLIGAFWFLIIRPQQQRAKQQAAMLSALSEGDRIVTIGGIYGTVVEVGEPLRVRVLDGSEFELARQAVAQVLPPEAVDVVDVTEDETDLGESQEPQEPGLDA